ncbi:MAG: OmpA family protein [Rhodanobacteraceae bacterium]|jgi:OOP family OmpA-OmpF porin|nr:OmpA family protein [Rhodanobacteraceae bacterium]
MKRNALSALIALALVGGGAVAHAQDFGNWYVAPRIGADFPDSNRKTDTSVWAGIGVGVWVNPHLAIDFEYGINNASFKDDSWRPGREWESVTLGVSGRWFFGDEGAQWRPYVMGGVGAQRHAAYSGILLKPAGFGTGGSWDPMATIGGGVQYNLNDRVALRGEIAARYDHDNNTRGNVSDALGYQISHKSGYVDGIVSVGLVYNFGERAAPPPPPPAAPPPPPPPPPAEEVPPQKVVIDLRGVNFKFDRPKTGEHNIEPTLQVPSADSIAILDQAVDVLKRNPEVKVELDGHTDSVGTNEYNQKLSERRAQIVYDYLTAHGIPASQITGVKGFGEDRPIDTNATKEGRARNRRTEMVVENPQ